jgi:hypothetical protein
MPDRGEAVRRHRDHRDPWIAAFAFRRGRRSMHRVLLTFVAGLGLVASDAVVWAQAMDEHAAHHGPATAPPASAPAPDQGSAMMEGGAMPIGNEEPMMRMMQGMTDMMQGMMQMMQNMPAMTDRMSSMSKMARPTLGAMTEPDFARLKSQLGITPAQMPQWDAFAAALRSLVQTMSRGQMPMTTQDSAMSWPDRLAQHERRLSAQLAAMKAMEQPMTELWNNLSPEQQRMAATMLPGRMRMQ